MNNEIRVYRDLLKMLIDWAMENGCYRKSADDPDDPGGIDNYFTIQPGKKGKPCFAKTFPAYQGKWPKIKLASYEDGALIVYRAYHGWFIGNDADLGNYLARAQKGNETRISNQDRDFHYAKLIGDDERVNEMLVAFNSNREKYMTLSEIQDSFRLFYVAMGIPYQEHLSLLDAPLEEAEERDE